MAKREGIKTLAEKMAELIGRMDAELAEENGIKETKLEKKYKND